MSKSRDGSPGDRRRNQRKLVGNAAVWVPLTVLAIIAAVIAIEQ